MKHSRPGFGVIHDDTPKQALPGDASQPFAGAGVHPAPLPLDVAAAKKAAEARQAIVNQNTTQVIPKVAPLPLKNATAPAPQNVKAVDHPLKLEVKHG